MRFANTDWVRVVHLVGQPPDRQVSDHRASSRSVEAPTDERAGLYAVCESRLAPLSQVGGRSLTGL
jgi:hypothetical protein